MTSPKSRKLLVIDWDFVFPVVEDARHDHFGLYDWGHNEAWGPTLQEALWVSRAAGFLQHDQPLPGIDSSLAHRLQEHLAPHVAGVPRLDLADSNTFAFSRPTWHRNTDEVWLFDAHHDSGYSGTIEDVVDNDRVICEDWMIGYHLQGADLHVRYPEWRDWRAAEPTALLDGQPNFDRQTVDWGEALPDFDRVFICRSGSWVPPWTDVAFKAWLESWGDRKWNRPLIDTPDTFPVREWWERTGLDQACAQADIVRRLRGEVSR